MFAQILTGFVQEIKTSYGFQWIPKDSYGFLWIPTDSWIPKDSYGFLDLRAGECCIICELWSLKLIIAKPRWSALPRTLASPWRSVDRSC